MNDFLKLLINYWKPLLGLLFLIIGFIFALIRKKPLNDVLSDLYTLCIQGVNASEEFAHSRNNFTSIEKLNYAVQYVLKGLSNKYPTLQVETYIKLIEAIIESILATPHKKG